MSRIKKLSRWGKEKSGLEIEFEGGQIPVQAQKNSVCAQTYIMLQDLSEFGFGGVV